MLKEAAFISQGLQGKEMLARQGEVGPEKQWREVVSIVHEDLKEEKKRGH